MCWLRILFMCCLLHLQQESFILKGFAMKLSFERGQGASYSTSVIAMVDLLPVERKHVQILVAYVKALEAKRQVLRSGVAEMRRFQRRRKPDLWQYFRLVRRLAADWWKWLSLMQRQESKSQAMRRLRKFLPERNDVDEADSGLLLIQKGYKLLPQDVANGLLDGVQYNITLNTFDRFELGWSLYGKGEFVLAAEWIRLAIAAYKGANVRLSELLGLRLSDMLLVYAQCFWHSNMHAMALQCFKDTEESSLYDVQFKQQKLRLVSSILERPRVPEIEEWGITDSMESFYIEDMCGFSSKRSYLKCRYKNDYPAFLILAPLKMEDLNLDPYLVLFHDVLYDNEIDLIKRKSLNKMFRARVVNETTNLGTVTDARTTHTIRFNGDDNWATKHISRRIVDMTGLTTKGSETLNVMNYGIGGFYAQHTDFFNSPHIVEGDRLATVLFYMSDVAQGGATAFPRTGNIINPRKGDALFWINLDGAVKGDEGTLHGACPVIVGSKWIVTKWIASKNQMFARPCPKDFLLDSKCTINKNNL